MSLIDQGEGRIVSLHFRVKLSPPEGMPYGETDGAADIAKVLLETGSAALKEVVAGQGYDIEILTTYFIF